MNFVIAYEGANEHKVSLSLTRPPPRPRKEIIAEEEAAMRAFLEAGGSVSRVSVEASAEVPVDARKTNSRLFVKNV